MSVGLRLSGPSLLNALTFIGDVSRCWVSSCVSRAPLSSRAVTRCHSSPHEGVGTCCGSGADYRSSFQGSNWTTENVTFANASAFRVSWCLVSLLVGMRLSPLVLLLDACYCFTYHLLLPNKWRDTMIHSHLAQCQIPPVRNCSYCWHASTSSQLCPVGNKC
jgi:hypothetical protein